jgi:hypothetical protein
LYIKRKARPDSDVKGVSAHRKEETMTLDKLATPRGFIIAGAICAAFWLAVLAIVL